MEMRIMFLQMKNKFKERTEKTLNERKSSFTNEKKLIELQLYFYLIKLYYLVGLGGCMIFSFLSDTGQ